MFSSLHNTKHPYVSPKEISHPHPNQEPRLLIIHFYLFTIKHSIQRSYASMYIHAILIICPWEYEKWSLTFQLVDVYILKYFLCSQEEF